MLFPTPRQKLLDQQGRPYYLWDCEMTLVDFLALWPKLQRYLGRQGPFWRWLLTYWGHDVDAIVPDESCVPPLPRVPTP